MKADVLVIILNFNGWRETLPCVDAVLAQTYKSLHIMLIDNGSADDSLQRLQRFQDHPRITFVKHAKNLGFAGGVNVGIQHAIKHNYPYIVLLNNDAIIAPDWLTRLRRTIKKQHVSSVTGLLLSGDGKKIESTGDGYSRWGLVFPQQRDEPTAQANESDFVFGGTAGASLYTTELFKDIGLFDETFFAYFEDTDINLRAQLAGHKAYYEKSAIGYHDHNTTSKKIPGFTVYQTFKNLPMCLWKNIPLRLFVPMFFRFYACYGLMYVRAILRGQFVIATKGLFMNISLMPHVFSQRWRIQRARRISVTDFRDILYPDLPPNNKRTARRIFHR
ncbi:glycosyltransferase family 2 protein [Candidatus Saccharibacteria bacterium]|nr:glycosyltransferase family 2 protein [Candidatus Saccharibacteria bacterium]